VSNQPENIKKGLFVCLLIKMLHLCLFLLLQSSHSLQNEWIRVPGGRSLLRECTHSIPSGSHLRFNTVTKETLVFSSSGEEIQRHPSCEKQHNDAMLRRSTISSTTDGPSHPFEWKTWTEASTGDDAIISRNGKWTVPAAPVKPNVHTLFYMGIALMPAAGKGGVILQPFLQWGFGAPDGGTQGYSIASWFVGNHTGFFTEQIEVGSGMIINGNMNKNVNNTWFVNVTGRGESAYFTTGPGFQPSTTDIDFTYGYNVIEAYNLPALASSCDAYPASSLTFMNMKMSTKKNGDWNPTGKWVTKKETQFPLACGEEATSNSASDTTLHWNGL